MLDALSKLYDLIDHRDRYKLWFLFGTVLMMALIETAGVASIFPFLSVASDPETIHTNTYISWMYTTLDFQDERSFLVALGVGMIGVLVVSNIIKAGTVYILQRFSWLQCHRLSKRLLAKYMNRQYPFFLTQNSSELEQEILSEVAFISRDMFIPGIRIIVMGTVILVLVGLLILTNPTLAVVVMLTIGGTYGLLWIVTQPFLSRTGEARYDGNRERFRVVQEAFEGIKEVKTLGRERSMVENFEAPSREFTKWRAIHIVIKRIPRFGIEILAFSTVVIVLLYFIAQGDDFTSVVPIIGLYAFAGYRMIPLLQRIFTGVSNENRVQHQASRPSL